MEWHRCYPTLQRAKVRFRKVRRFPRPPRYGHGARAGIQPGPGSAGSPHTPRAPPALQQTQGHLDSGWVGPFGDGKARDCGARPVLVTPGCVTRGSPACRDLGKEDHSTPQASCAGELGVQPCRQEDEVACRAREAPLTSLGLFSSVQWAQEHLGCGRPLLGLRRLARHGLLPLPRVPRLGRQAGWRDFCCRPVSLL